MKNGVCKRPNVWLQLICVSRVDVYIRTDIFDLRHFSLTIEILQQKVNFDSIQSFFVEIQRK